MRNKMSFIRSSWVFFVAMASSGQTVTTSGGNTNTVPLFTGSLTVGNSNITQVNGNIGIGTLNPQAVLDVWAFSQAQSGIGLNLTNVSGVPEINSITRILFAGLNHPGGFALIQAAGSDYGSGNGYLAFQTALGGTLAEQARLTSNGNFGLGTSTPGSRLESTEM
jgi:hypothetical protein